MSTISMCPTPAERSGRHSNISASLILINVWEVHKDLAKQSVYYPSSLAGAPPAVETQPRCRCVCSHNIDILHVIIEQLCEQYQTIKASSTCFANRRCYQYQGAVLPITGASQPAKMSVTKSSSNPASPTIHAPSTGCASICQKTSLTMQSLFLHPAWQLSWPILA